MFSAAFSELVRMTMFRSTASNFRRASMIDIIVIRSLEMLMTWAKELKNSSLASFVMPAAEIEPSSLMLTSTTGPGVMKYVPLTIGEACLSIHEIAFKVVDCLTMRRAGDVRYASPHFGSAPSRLTPKDSPEEDILTSIYPINDPPDGCKTGIDSKVNAGAGEVDGAGVV